MVPTDPNGLFPALAVRLAEEADSLTDEWLERLNERVGVRPRRLMPTAYLREQVPAVLRAGAEVLGAPAIKHPNGTVDILRTVAQRRREHGGDIQEILTDLDVLGELVFERLEGWVEELGLDAASTVRAASRLSAVLRMIASVQVGTYREEELRHQRELAEHLAEFAGMVRHELQNPISIAAISAALLTNEQVCSSAEERHKHADRIRTRLERMQFLLDDLQAIAIAERALASPRWTSVSEIARTVFDEVQSAADRHDVVLKLDAPKEDFEVDAARMEIALVNLVNNGIKFCDPKKKERSVRVRIDPKEVQGAEGLRRIVVEDNGLGIAPEARDRIFQRFFREHPEIEGTGLGLSIARHVVEQRGGRIWFESEKGRGTAFFIELPERLAAREQEVG